MENLFLYNTDMVIDLVGSLDPNTVTHMTSFGNYTEHILHITF